jgi:hypothetical protein
MIEMVCTSKRSALQMKEPDIYEIIENKDEAAIKRRVIRMLKAVISNPEEKDEISYFDSYFITVPRELGWSDNYHFKDTDLADAISVMANFEGDTNEEAIRKSKKLLKILKKK